VIRKSANNIFRADILCNQFHRVFYAVNDAEKGAGIGTLGGAAAGGIIGGTVGHAGAGAAIGGLLGLGAGALIGDQLQGQDMKQDDQQQRIDYEQRELDRQRREIERLKQGEY
jgi:outer membrane lipoprotein SlyB